MRTQRFRDHVAFITGASSGIGAATARTLAQQGAHVTLIARRAERLERVAAELRGHGVKALALVADVRSRTELDAAVERCVDELGRIDVVVANAGFGVMGPVTRLETVDFRRQLETNFFGVVDTLYATLPHVTEARGRIALLSSVLGRVGMPSSAPYAASKFALIGLAESIRYDLDPLGVSVTCINPGYVESEIRTLDNQGRPTGEPDPVPKRKIMPSQTAARQIVDAIYRRQPEMVLTTYAKLAVTVARHLPSLARYIIGRRRRGLAGRRRSAGLE